MLDLVEGHRLARGRPAQIGPDAANLLDAVPRRPTQKAEPSPIDRVVVDNSLEGEGVVGVDPICNLLVIRPCIEVLTLDSSDLRNHRVERRALLLQRCVVHARSDDVAAEH